MLQKHLDPQETASIINSNFPLNDSINTKYKIKNNNTSACEPYLYVQKVHVLLKNNHNKIDISNSKLRTPGKFFTAVLTRFHAFANA